MIKLFAVILTVSSGIYTGNTLSKHELTKLKNAEELHSLISQISVGIEKLALPLSDIFSKYTSGKNKPESVEAILSSRRSFGDKVMDLARESCSPVFCMEINEFTKTLGLVDRDTQIRLAKNALVSIENELSRKRTEYLSKSKLYKTLSLLISCVVAVLLY